MHDQKLTNAEYKQQRRRQLDALVDNAELLNSIALRYSRRRAWWRAFWQALLKGLVVFGSVAAPLIALSDKVVEFWHWVWSHGGQ